MHVAEIIYPGTWLDLPDRDLAFELEGEIAISQATLQVLVETVNKVLHAFPWKGPAHVAPS